MLSDPPEVENTGCWLQQMGQIEEILVLSSAQCEMIQKQHANLPDTILDLTNASEQF